MDAGAYDGDTLMEFLTRTGGEFDAIYAFELDRANFEAMQGAVGGLAPRLQEKIKLFNLGVLDEAGEITYESGGSGKQSTFINVIRSAEDKGWTVRISDALKGEKVTFIKMDIEGAEPQALRGRTGHPHQRPSSPSASTTTPTPLGDPPLHQGASAGVQDLSETPHQPGIRDRVLCGPLTEPVPENGMERKQSWKQAKREKFLREKPRCGEDPHDRGALTPGDIATPIIDIAYSYACNLRCDHCTASRFKKKNGGGPRPPEDGAQRRGGRARALPVLPLRAASR